MKTHDWKNRKVDWEKQYFTTFDHPHRKIILEELRAFGKWGSLYELGVGGGANMKAIVLAFPNRQVGGCDINPEAIEFCKSKFNGALLQVGSADNIMMSDKTTDVVLSDMTLLYVKDVNKVLKEIKRITRHYVILCELHSFKKCGIIKLWWKDKYYAHNYKRLLEKHGFYDINLIKIPKEIWDGEPQTTYGYVITAKVGR